MRQQERQDLVAVQEQLRADRKVALEGIDLNKIEDRDVRDAMMILSSGALLASIDLGDILSGRGRQDD